MRKVSLSSQVPAKTIPESIIVKTVKGARENLSDFSISDLAEIMESIIQ
ncbi:MAG TPA: hypothetical protein PK926_16085 [Spirochaetota bacterium]|nr:hypothetical protein [Spirochaetota bacterium]HPI90532.1 hypothetical protein [Spirochaetota bacterium]HPR47868.1 hypothetical protein [Spirochaetota bacterium]